MQESMTIHFDPQEAENLCAAAEHAGMSPKDWIKKATLRQALYDKDPELAPHIIAGLDDVEAGRVISDEEMHGRMVALFGPELDG